MFWRLKFPAKFRQKTAVVSSAYSLITKAAYNLAFLRYILAIFLRNTQVTLFRRICQQIRGWFSRFWLDFAKIKFSIGKISSNYTIQVNLCQKLFFLQNMGSTCLYKNCDECQKQFLYTTCSTQVWAENFHALNL